MRAARAAADIKPMTACDLRHNFITEALTGGVDPMTISKIVGTSLQMIDVTYGKLIEAHATRAFKNVRLV